MPIKRIVVKVVAGENEKSDVAAGDIVSNVFNMLSVKWHHANQK